MNTMISEWTTGLPAELWILILSFVPWMRRTLRLVDSSLAYIFAQSPSIHISTTSECSPLARVLNEIRWLNLQEDLRRCDWPSSGDAMMMNWSPEFFVHWYELDPSVHLPFMRAIRLDLLACRYGRFDLLPWFKEHAFPQDEWLISMLRGHRVTVFQLTAYGSMSRDEPIPITAYESVLQAVVDSARRDYWEWYLKSDWLISSFPSSSDDDNVIRIDPIDHVRSALVNDPALSELSLLDEILSTTFCSDTRPLKKLKLDGPHRPRLELVDNFVTHRMHPFLERDRWDVVLGILMALRCTDSQRPYPLSGHRLVLKTRKLTKNYFAGADAELWMNGEMLAEMVDRNVMPCWCGHLYILCRIWNTPAYVLQLDARTYVRALVRHCIRSPSSDRSSWNDCQSLEDFMVAQGQTCSHTPSFETLLDWVAIGQRTDRAEWRVYRGCIFQELCSDSYSRPSDDPARHERWRKCFDLLLSTTDLWRNGRYVRHACRSGDVLVMKLLLEKRNEKKSSSTESWFALLDPSSPAQSHELGACASMLDPTLPFDRTFPQLFQSPKAPDPTATLRQSRVYINSHVGRLTHGLPCLMTLWPLVQSERPENALLDWMLTDGSAPEQWFRIQDDGHEAAKISETTQWLSVLYRCIERRDLFNNHHGSSQSAVHMRLDQWLGYMFMHRRLLTVAKAIFTRLPWCTFFTDRWVVIEAMRYAACNGFVPMLRDLMSDTFWISVLDAMDQRAWSEDDWRTMTRSWCALFGQTEMLPFFSDLASEPVPIFCLTRPRIEEIAKWSKRSGIRVTLRLPSKTQMHLERLRVPKDNVHADSQLQYPIDIFDLLDYDHEWLDTEHLHREWSSLWTRGGMLYEIHPLKAAVRRDDDDALLWCARHMDLEWFTDYEEVEKFRKSTQQCSRPSPRVKRHDLTGFSRILQDRLSSCTLPFVKRIKENLCWLPGF